MKVHKKLFVVSDVHGHCTLLKQELERAGFDRNDPTHLLVCCGDYFDRGTENLGVLRFFDSLENKVLLRGNHEDLLLRLFQTGIVQQHNFINGTVETLTEFFGKNCIDPLTNTVDFSGKTRMLDRATDFILQTCDYFETENYIFVHGWLPVREPLTGPYVPENWRDSMPEAWEKARWIKWADMYGTCEIPEGKTLVCGHYPSFFAKWNDASRGPGDTSIFFGDRLIVIDAGTYTSGKINVFVTEDDL